MTVYLQAVVSFLHLPHRTLHHVCCIETASVVNLTVIRLGSYSNLTSSIVDLFGRFQPLLFCRLFHPLILILVHFSLRSCFRQDIDIVNDERDRLRLQSCPRHGDCQIADFASDNVDGKTESVEDVLLEM